MVTPGEVASQQGADTGMGKTPALRETPRIKDLRLFVIEYALTYEDHV